MGKQFKMRTALAAAAGSAVLALALAGCDSASDTDSDPGGYGAPDDEQTGAVAAATLTTADSSLGEILVDGEGMTLYLFTEDTEGASACYDDCAEAWPPLISEEGEATAEGRADEGLLGTVERTDGAVQVTYNGHPLYYWASDSAPGDVLGQGVNDVWYVLDPDGNAITESAG